MLRIGCCGFPVAKTKYYENFDLIEVQQTFYQPPSQRVLMSWRAGAPENFEFIVKAWQLITHDPSSPTYNKLVSPIPDFKRLCYGSFRPTDEVWRAWGATDQAAGILRARIILFQCPPGFRPTEENIGNMRNFFSRVERKDYIFVWEPRGRWEEKSVRRLCEELDLVHCSDPFKHEPCFGGIKYLRLHGRDRYNYRYSEDEIKELAKRCNDRNVYVMFNNTNMYDDAIKLKEHCLSTNS